MKTGEEAAGALLDILNWLSLVHMVVGSFSSNRCGIPGMIVGSYVDETS